MGYCHVTAGAAQIRSCRLRRPGFRHRWLQTLMPDIAPLTGDVQVCWGSL